MASNISWNKIVHDFKILDHDFSTKPFPITAAQIKQSVAGLSTTGEREVRLLCKQDTREQRPQVFKDNNLFLLPTMNGHYAILKGDGYLDIPTVEAQQKQYASKLEFKLESAEVGNSEMQHLDYAYAVSLIRTFCEDPTLVLTIRGRKYTPEFSFNFHRQAVAVKGVQTEVDAGFEGKNQIVLIEAKNSKTTNTIIRQLYYPYRQWTEMTSKKVRTLFFEKRGAVYNIWEFTFSDIHQYESIELLKTASYVISE